MTGMQAVKSANSNYRVINNLKFLYVFINLQKYFAFLKESDKNSIFTHYLTLLFSVTGKLKII